MSCFFSNQKTAYELRISDWSSDVCSSDLLNRRVRRYRVTFADPMHFLVRDEGSFGDTSEAAALRIVESIAGDPDRQRLLVADEYTSDEGGRHPSNLREYTFD